MDPVLETFQVVTGAIAIYNSCETFGLIFSTFKSYKTLYFWSLVGASLGDFLFAIGFLDLFFGWYVGNSTIYRPLIVLTIGWYGMVTGFSIVMYSRLSIIGVERDVIRRIRYFIIYNVVFSHFPTTVFTFGANVIGTPFWVIGYSIIEKIQMTMFAIQEVMLGAMYLHYTRKMRYDKKITPIVRHTLYANMFVLVLDIAMLLTEYINLYSYQIMLKTVVYSVKLKMEFYILNILTSQLKSNTSAPKVSITGTISKQPRHAGEASKRPVLQAGGVDKAGGTSSSETPAGVVVTPQE
ncbi:unnamed protein product (mitochondrion) [Plasmodiophora brassicae]|uniref:DUF7703 domain-containing protein n=1 Tax=Plasmodiophora brassicae TaxID=37360 RepID=A0A0G4J3V6_PLABS|nr:hypothetical protein PBRA_002226 [Plasmodiophora brassicae]SPQ98820.1 unnamed protein product [Plasmodiophora brassicae]